jgi:hypothetical protein
LGSGFRLDNPASILVDGFNPVPAVALRDPELSRLDLHVLGYAWRFALSPTRLSLYASHAYLADVFGITTRQVKRALSSLVRTGYLQVDRRARGKHNVYRVATEVPPARRPLLRSPIFPVSLDPPPRPEGTKPSPQNPVRGQNRPLDRSNRVVEGQREATPCLVAGPLKKQVDADVSRGAPVRGALGLALRQWRERLAEADSEADVAHELCFIGIRKAVALKVAKDVAHARIVRASTKLDVETRNLAGAFLHHLNGTGEKPEGVKG